MRHPAQSPLGRNQAEVVVAAPGELAPKGSAAALHVATTIGTTVISRDVVLTPEAALALGFELIARARAAGATSETAEGQPALVVVVDGGRVSEVRGATPGSVIVVDHDTDNCGKDPEELPRFAGASAFIEIEDVLIDATAVSEALEAMRLQEAG